jgi:hypothetical protein
MHLPGLHQVDAGQVGPPGSSRAKPPFDRLVRQPALGCLPSGDDTTLKPEPRFQPTMIIIRCNWHEHRMSSRSDIPAYSVRSARYTNSMEVAPIPFPSAVDAASTTEERRGCGRDPIRPAAGRGSGSSADS